MSLKENRKIISRKLIFSFSRNSFIVLMLLTLTFVFACYQEHQKNGNFEEFTKKTFQNKINFELPDGTKVYLNKNSELIYFQDFDKFTREVTIQGEAYFEVARNEDLTFMVHTPEGARVQVLGTAFYVNTRDGNRTVVRVKKGEVAFISPHNSFGHVFIKKNEMGVLTENSLTKAENDRPNYLSWQSGILIFINAPLEEVVRDLSEYYDTTVIIKGNKLEYDKLTTLINNQTLDGALEKLKSVLGIDYKSSEEGLMIFKDK